MPIKPRVIVPDWSAPMGVRAFTTTRVDGYSQNPYQGFNLALHVGDDPEAVSANRAMLGKNHALPTEPLWLEQVHGTCVLEYPTDRSVVEAVPQADASVAFKPLQVCVVLTADCLPVLVCDRQGSVVAAVHAGWRGLCAGILEAALARLNTDPTQCMAWLGPAISAKHYEVGAEVFEAFSVDERQQGFIRKGTDRWYCDLYALARQRLRNAGLHTISGGDQCTYGDSERFYSYRRSGVTGRMASLIWLEAP